MSSVRVSLRAVAVSAIAAGVVACGQSPSSADGGVSFANDIQPILNNRCVGCHNVQPDGGNPRGNLNLATGAHANLVGVAVAGQACTTQKPGAIRVTANDPNASQMWLKVSASADRCGNVMPPPSDGGTSATLDQASQDKIRAWISAGAPNN